MPRPKIMYEMLRTDLKPHIRQFILILLLTFLTVGFEAIAPWPFRFLIDNVFSGGEYPFPEIFKTAFAFGFFIVFVYFVNEILLDLTEYFRSIVLKNAVKQIMYSFSRRAFSNIEMMNMGFYRTQEIGDYIYRLSNDVSALGAWVEDGLLPIITSILFILVTSTVLFFIDVKLTLVSLIALPFLAAGLFFFNKRIVLVTKRSERLNSQLFSFIQEALTQLKMIQAFSQERAESRKFDDRMKRSLATEYKLNKLNFMLSLIIGVLIAITYSIIIGYGIVSVMNKEITVGLLVIFIFYLDNLTAPILEVIYAMASAKENWVKIEHMNDFFDKSGQVREQGRLRDFGTTAIHFLHVTLEGKEHLKILDKVDVSIPEKKMTVVVGVSGSGKSTLVSLIPRLVDEPTTGHIMLGGHDIREYDLKVLREKIALVPQEHVLFNASVHDVIAFGMPHATRAQVEHAARMAQAADFIERLPGGYDFKVGEAGNYLSGGQRQRLLLARAFVKPAEIYIMDEPLSSLDLETRKKVWKSILEVTKNKTTVIISNVLDVINTADHVIMMNQGKMVTSGKHLDLLKDSSLYNLIIHAE